MMRRARRGRRESAAQGGKKRGGKGRKFAFLGLPYKNIRNNIAECNIYFKT